MHHDREAPIDVTNHGVLFLNSSVRYEDIGDGAAQTLFVGERLVVPGDLGWASGTKATLRNMGEPINQVKNPVLPLPALAVPPVVAEDEPEEGEPGKPAPKKVTAPAAKAAEKPTDPVGGFSSHHPGGANFAFGDGSVRFLKASAAQKVLYMLANRNDGEMISADQY